MVSSSDINSSTSSSQPQEEYTGTTEVAEQPVVQPAIVNAHAMATRAQSGISKPNPRYVMLTIKGIPEAPKTVATDLKHSGWNRAMGEEIDTCNETNTWSLVPSPDDFNVLGCKWVCRTKLNDDGTLDKLTAIIIAKWYEQEEGIDFLDTYSPVVRTGTVRMVLYLATIEGWELKQLDVKNGFLHGDLKEIVYMEQPLGFEDQKHPDYVCKLHKAIYGLKQAPRAWFDKFSLYMLEFGFICSIGDPSLFIYQKGNSILILLLYVDDMVLTGNDQGLVQTFLSTLNEKFRMKDMGFLHYFLGIQVQRTSTGLFLNQEKYAKDLLQTAGMLDCAPMPYLYLYSLIVCQIKTKPSLIQLIFEV